MTDSRASSRRRPGTGAAPAESPDALAVGALFLNGAPPDFAPTEVVPLRGGLQALQRGLPALPDVARCDRRRELAEALELHLVLHPKMGSTVGAIKAVAEVAGEGPPVLVLLKHCWCLRAGYSGLHLFLHARAEEVVVARLGAGVLGRARAGLEVTVEPPLGRRDRPPHCFGRPLDVDAFTEVRHRFSSFLRAALTLLLPRGPSTRRLRRASAGR